METKTPTVRELHDAYRSGASTVRATISVLGNPFTFNKAVSLTPAQFNYAFTNELNPEESKKVYDRLQIPGAARILGSRFQTLT